MASMPDLSVGPRAERVPAMAAWLQRHGIAYDATAGDNGIRKAWAAEKKRREKQAKRLHEREGHRDGTAPLPSSVQRAERRHAAREAAGPPPRNRNIDYAREHFGLFVDVPWAAWEGHEESTEVHRGMVWDYDRDTRRFTVRFAPTADWDCDDVSLSWEELRGEKPCLASPWQRALLDELTAPRMIPQPRGHRPRDAVWDQRKSAWVGCTGRDFDPGELLAIARD
mmetsp:Transcript_72647/g.144303  ORF Transcript_72647/g.144303 Transcript_72647/m.144303 type:complete len:225 (-) Transcript_72647:1336-2010(-)